MPRDRASAIFPTASPKTVRSTFTRPYGCSKGAADQYVHDYGRIYGIPSVVFRQSCIYGQRQFGVEDQGWVAWFSIAALLERPITIYGDGLQLRDLLHVDDLVAAYKCGSGRSGAGCGSDLQRGRRSVANAFAGGAARFPARSAWRRRFRSAMRNLAPVISLCSSPTSAKSSASWNGAQPSIHCKESGCCSIGFARIATTWSVWWRPSERGAGRFHGEKLHHHSCL